ncbi:hypothetical protein FC18_GL001161 [Lacticaseibacillus sharpeae JCM 1186 = DSM 20505]|uniref:Uncharacterized protein n=1 Tax=Lacticaseibacillus sharpeae JCM 1186 = DSM 20505 TaxID=1291052 RepID=A0A0R1ZL04_9LACO|nr:hypothetical protein FC18_GL001161 [Lacticaseibacillus sharpeae JCM 1186 = DSM 20505]
MKTKFDGTTIALDQFQVMTKPVIMPAPAIGIDSYTWVPRVLQPAAKRGQFSLNPANYYLFLPIII